MPAKSQAQQKLMGLALAVKRGNVAKSKVSKQIQQLANSMSEKDLKKFAGTKFKGLPSKLKEVASEADMEQMDTDSLLGMQRIIALTDNTGQYEELNTLLGIELSKRGVTLRKKTIPYNMYLGYDNNKLGSNFPQRESKGQTMKLKSILKNIHENTEDQVQISEEQKHAFLEHIKSFNVFGEAIYRSQNIIEALNEIKNIVETAHHLTLQETGDWFDKVTVNRHMKQLKESYKTFEKTANEMYTLQQRLEACYEDMGNTLNKYYNISEDGGANLQEKESDYQKTFSKVMKKAKIESPADLESDKQKKQFFKQLDKSYKSKEEQK
jgi:hypothetical protein